MTGLQLAAKQLTVESELNTAEANRPIFSAALLMLKCDAETFTNHRHIMGVASISHVLKRHAVSDEQSYQAISVMQHTFFPGNKALMNLEPVDLVSIWVVCPSAARFRLNTKLLEAVNP